MTRPILVTGGRGTLGREVVSRLLDAGHDVRLLSRHPGPAGPHLTTHAVDLRAGGGLDEALDGAGAIVHCATGGRGDVAAARNLIAAAARARTPHLVYISIVGVDRVPLGYYQAKLEVERLLERSAVPWTILRTTQFHTLVARVFSAQRRLPVTLVPALRVQPVDPAEVAYRLVELATAPPAGRVADVGGPEVRDAPDLASSWLRAHRRRRPILPVWLPGATFAAYRRGGHLAPGHATGRVTFEQFLETSPR